MLVSDFTYDLPEDRIAKFPPKVRGTTRLLVLDKKTGEVKDSYYKDLVDFLNPGDLLILNDTRVMRSRLFCQLPDGRKRELVVLEKHGDEPQRVMYRGKLHDNDILYVNKNKIIVRKILGNGIAEVESNTSLADLAEKFGTVPLPPYLHRDATDDDKKRYQTVWARNMGSAAAPTASLNMTEELLEKLKQKGVVVKYLTLHVGLGTFLPIRTDNIEDHKMHSEWYSIPEDTLREIRHRRVTRMEGDPRPQLARTGEEKARQDPSGGYFFFPLVPLRVLLAFFGLLASISLACSNVIFFGSWSFGIFTLFRRPGPLMYGP